jgi:uncharacterized protein YjiS (DUF1127 family)
MNTMHPSAKTLRLFPLLPRTPRRPSGFERMRAALHAMAERSRTRPRLAVLDERMLRDIGLSSDEVDAEWRKPFWQP